MKLLLPMKRANFSKIEIEIFIYRKIGEISVDILDIILLSLLYSGVSFGGQKRAFDEIDRSGFDRFVKKNFDEIDRSGFDRFVKKDYDEIDRSGFDRFVE